MQDKNHIYNYSVLPQWQQFPRIEFSLANLVQSLSDQAKESLQCGSGRITSQTKTDLKRIASFNDPLIDSILYRETTPLIDSSSPYFWSIDQLASNPYTSLCSWLQAYNAMLDNKSIVSLSEFSEFHQSTLYLLCVCIPATATHPYFNPSEVYEHLYRAFVRTSKAFLALKESYPPIIQNDDGNGTVDATTVEFTVYDPYLVHKREWHFVDVNVVNAMREVFEKHLQADEDPASENEDPAFEDDLNDLAHTLLTLFEKNAKASYLLPFICTKLFTEYLHSTSYLNSEDSQSTTVNINGFACDELYSYETFKRLLNRHHSKLKDDTSEHPIIAFMQDAVRVLYNYESSRPELSASDLLTQIDANWLALSLYGSRRYFADPQICSHYSGLTLPILLRHLYDCQNNTLLLNTDWLLSLAKVSNLTFKSDNTTNKLRELCLNALEELEDRSDSEDWKSELATLIFTPELWTSATLSDTAPASSTLVKRINECINKVAAFLKKRKEDPKVANTVVRLSGIMYLFNPALEALHHYLNNLATPEEQHILFQDLISVDKLIKGEIESYCDECAELFK